jgi:hypothetical protein
MFFLVKTSSGWPTFSSNVNLGKIFYFYFFVGYYSQTDDATSWVYDVINGQPKREVNVVAIKIKTCANK